MWELILQITIILGILTGFFTLNLRIWASFKKGIDPVKAFRKQDLSLAEALQADQDRFELFKNG